MPKRFVQVLVCICMLLLDKVSSKIHYKTLSSIRIQTLSQKSKIDVFFKFLRIFRILIEWSGKLREHFKGGLAWKIPKLWGYPMGVRARDYRNSWPSKSPNWRKMWLFIARKFRSSSVCICMPLPAEYHQKFIMKRWILLGGKFIANVKNRWFSKILQNLKNYSRISRVAQEAFLTWFYLIE